MSPFLVDLIYLFASVLMLAGVWHVVHTGRAAWGSLLTASGALLALLATLPAPEVSSLGVVITGILLGAAIGALLGLTSNRDVALARLAFLIGGAGLATALVAGIRMHDIGAKFDADVRAQAAVWKGIPDAVRKANVENVPTPRVPVRMTFPAALAAALGGLIWAAGMVCGLKLSRSPLRKSLPRLEDPSMGQAAAVVVSLLLALLFAAWPMTETFLWLLILTGMPLGYLLTIHLKIADAPPVLAAVVGALGCSLAAAGLTIGNLQMVTAGALVTAGGGVVARKLSQSMNVSLLGLVRGTVSSRSAATDDEPAERKSPPPPPGPATATADADVPML